jgi:hypothetical protein
MMWLIYDRQWWDLFQTDFLGYQLGQTFSSKYSISIELWRGGWLTYGIGWKFWISIETVTQLFID